MTRRNTDQASLSSSRGLLAAVVMVAIMAVSAAHSAASAAEYPEASIRLVIGFGQGGPTDSAARILADHLTKRLGQQVVVENRPGAAGNIATKEVADADADGYTFLVGALPLAVNHTIFPEFPVKFGRDIVALGPIGSTSNVLVVNPSMGVSTLEEFKAVVLAQPGKVSHVIFGKGSSSNLSGVSFDRQSGTKLLPVPYKRGSDAVKDILGGHVQAWFAPLTSVGELVKAGKLVALGVTGPRRVAMLPDVPTFAEQGFESFDVRLWVGMFARTGIPADRMATFTAALHASLGSDEMKSALSNLGMDPMEMDQSAFSAFVSAEIGRWASALE